MWINVESPVQESNFETLLMYSFRVYYGPCFNLIRESNFLSNCTWGFFYSCHGNGFAKSVLEHSFEVFVYCTCDPMTVHIEAGHK